MGLGESGAVRLGRVMLSHVRKWDEKAIDSAGRIEEHRIDMKRLET